MKKLATFTLPLLLLAAVVILLTIFGDQSEKRGFQIAPMELTADQWELMDLLSHPGREILLFEYQLDETFDRIELWVEVYHYGELQETPINLQMLGFGGVGLTEGRVVITIQQTQNHMFQWMLQTAGGSAHNSEPWSPSVNYLAWAFGPITEPVQIEDGQVIVLYTSIFSSSGVLSTFTDKQIYLEGPELLAQYPYVHMILARFSR